MKKISYVFFLLTWLSACDSNEESIKDQDIQFSVNLPSHLDNQGGRTSSNAKPEKVIVTITNESGTVVAERRELSLYTFGDNYLTLPLTLRVNSFGKYHLTEFLVLDNENHVLYATPVEGSKNAHLVTDPLDIEFGVSKDEITTVTPEVLELNTNSNSIDYGYGQFGFTPVSSVKVVFSAFIKGVSNFELTTAHLKVEGLDDNNVVWTYESELEAKANIVLLRKITNYRITATKPGYKQWQETHALSDGDKLEILFEKDAEIEFEKIWNKHFGGSSTESLARSIATSDGGTLTIGYSYSKDHDVSVPTGQSDAWLLKLNSSGVIEWSKSYGKSLWDFGTSVTEFTDGSGYLVTGYSVDTPGVFKGWLMKINRQGAVEWEKSTGSLVPYNSIAANNGNYLLVGEVFANLTTLRMVDKNGNTIWEKGTNDPFGHSAEVVKQGNAYYLTLHKSVVKMDEQGNFIWKTPSPSMYFSFITTVITSDGLLVACDEQYNVTIDGIYYSRNRQHVFKFGTNGEFLWKKPISGSDETGSIKKIILTSSGDFLAVGSSFSYETKLQRAWIFRLTSQGDKIGEKFLHGSAQKQYIGSRLNNIFHSGNDYTVVGNTSDKEGHDIPGNYGSTDWWIMKIRF